jgi:uncharacterized membrane protein
VEPPVLDLLARWVHLVAAIVWMGHNYVNVVQRPRFEPIAIADTPGSGSPGFMAALFREHAVFRWASVVSWVSGVFMLWQRDRLVDAFTLSSYHAVVGVGAWIGTLMMLNVWLVLWPHQKKVLGFVPATPGERVRASRVTFLSARVNTMLSVPLLFFMLASQHGLELFR